MILAVDCSRGFKHGTGRHSGRWNVRKASFHSHECGTQLGNEHLGDIELIKGCAPRVIQVILLDFVEQSLIADVE